MRREEYMSEKMSPFRYEDEIPPEYKCDECGAHGVRLYRDYQTIARATRLLCTKHAETAGSEPRKVDAERPDQIGWMVAAVPTEDGETFWGFTSVPWNGVFWWRSLPTVAGQPQPPDGLIAWLRRNAANMQTLLELRDKMLERQAAEIARLRAALRPFAAFAKEYGPVASALDYPEDHVLLHVGTAPEAVVVRLSDLYAAAEALGEET